jgi:hypothetical protein
MNARSTAASDWVDYALNQRTVVDPSTGQLTKVSSSYTYTWRDSTGQHIYQTTDPNANPNGTMPGNWTKQQVGAWRWDDVGDAPPLHHVYT